MFFSKHKETLVVLKIMLPDNKRTFWYTYKAHLILLSTLTSEFCLFGNRTVLYITLPNAEPRMGVCRREAPQPSGSEATGPRHSTLSIPVCYANIIIS